MSKEDTPKESLAGGTIVRLQEPRHTDDKDDRSQIVARHVIVSAKGSGLFVGSCVAVAQSTGRWRILTMGNTMTVISQDRTAPYKRDTALGDVTEQFAQRLKVYAPHTMISPRTWSEPPVEANMLAECPTFPTRTSRNLAREMASANGATDCCELSDDTEEESPRVS